MNQVWGSKVPLYFETEESQLVLGDSFKILTKMKQESVDMILCNVPDIHIVPFGLSTFLHNLIHFLLNLCFSSTLVPLSESLSHEPLFTETILPP